MDVGETGAEPAGKIHKVYKRDLKQAYLVRWLDVWYQNTGGSVIQSSYHDCKVCTEDLPYDLASVLLVIEGWLMSRIFLTLGNTAIFRYSSHGCESLLAAETDRRADDNLKYFIVGLTLAKPYARLSRLLSCTNDTLEG